MPLTAFISFLQNHDQIGNRAFGERIDRLASEAAARAATLILLLAPAPPMLFMGEEWAAEEPFLFFCDFGADLGRRVVEGRRAEFARFPEFADPARRDRIPSPEAESTHAACILRWEALDEPAHRGRHAWTRDILGVRQREIAPRLAAVPVGPGASKRLGAAGLAVEWRLGDGALLRLVANLSAEPVEVALPWSAPGRRLFAWPEDGVSESRLAPWSAAYYIDAPAGASA